VSLVSRRAGITRKGSKRRFRYYDRNDQLITDPATLARIESLVIPPAWTDVWIAGRAGVKLQATGVDKAGRRQYLYHPDFRARQEQAKYDKLVRFAEKLPDLRAAMSADMDDPELSHDRVCAVAVRLINLGWFRVGNERYAKTSRTFGITTLRKRHVTIRGSRISFKFRAKHSIQVHTALVDADVASALKELIALPGSARLFRYERDGEIYPLDAKKLNDYIRKHMGPEFSAKDFRTWGGTLVAAVALAERGLPETQTAQKKVIAGVMRKVGEQLGNTPAVARTSYVSPAVVDQYLDGRTIEDFRPRHLRVVGARETGLDVEERALLALLRSFRIRSARKAA
jgi:DNA topoisomerase I